MPDAAHHVAAIVLAGGSGTRLGLGGGRNKVYLPLGGLPLLAWSLRTLDRHPLVDRLVLVARAGDDEDVAAAVAAAQLSTPVVVVQGGASRTASEAAGFQALRSAGLGGAEVVLVHDGARPFLRAALVDALIAAALRAGAAVPGLALAPDLVTVADDGLVAPLASAHLRRVQTPQAFRADVLQAAFAVAHAEGIEGADTAELVAATGGPAAEVVPGDPDNIKVTRPEDVALAERLAATWALDG